MLSLGVHPSPRATKSSDIATNEPLGIPMPRLWPCLKVSLASAGFMGDGREKERSVWPEGDRTDGRRRRREGESRERRGARRSTSARRSSEEGPRNQPWTGV